METCWWIVAVWVDVIGLGQAPAITLGPNYFERMNRGMQGQLVDFTHNHGRDNRIWSPSLQQRRDLYVYLPPGFNPNKKYPLIIFLHGAAQDEQIFAQSMVCGLDNAIAKGRFPPVIVAVPDGSTKGRPSLFKPATFFANSRLGRFEDFVMCDVWDFVHCHFPILPIREAHALMGVSMGGSAAFALAIKHRQRIKSAVGLHPVVNLRYVDCHDNYRTAFNPCCFRMRSVFRGWEPLGRRKTVVLRFGKLFRPLFGHGDAAVQGMRRINPYDLMEDQNLQPGELDLYIGYGGKDEFNVGAQVESFLWRAKQRGISVAVKYDPKGGHNMTTTVRMMPHLREWAATRIPNIK